MKRLTLLIFLALFLLNCSKNKQKEERKENVFYEKAYEYRESGQQDSAFLYYNKAKDIFLQEQDSLGTGKCLVNMAMISTAKGDYFGGQELSLSAIPYFNTENDDHHVQMVSNFNNLGTASYNLKLYKKAITFYEQSLSYSKNSAAILSVKNNIATLYSEEKDYLRSLDLYQDILKQNLGTKEFARVLSNFTFTKWLQNPNYNAIPDLLKALSLNQKENDLWGQNASYAHIADYYTNKQPDSALQYATRMYNIARVIKSADDQLLALQKLIKLSPPKETKRYFEIYHPLNDSVQTARSAAKNQFALIRYESEKHKADFLNAQAENIQKQNNIFRQNILLGLLATSLILGYFWYRKRKKGLQQEKELEVKNTELKYVRKIHDRVANKVYHVMSEVENTEELNKDALLDQLEGLYNVSRDISYDSKDPNIEENFTQHLTNMLKTHSSEIVNVSITGNKKSLWEKVNSTSKSEIFYVLQELLTNMSKHSEADRVSLKFSRMANHIEIHYTDNGIGISGIPQFKNGLSNTGIRIKNISGTITFDTKVEKGLAIHISFPVS